MVGTTETSILKRSGLTTVVTPTEHLHRMAYIQFMLLFGLAAGRERWYQLPNDLKFITSLLQARHTHWLPFGGFKLSSRQASAEFVGPCLTASLSSNV